MKAQYEILKFNSVLSSKLLTQYCARYNVTNMHYYNN